MGEPSQNRTWLCSVVFVDVVSYTKNLLAGQLAVKEVLDREIIKQLAECNQDDYILLDRGDGAAVCFMVEPETALFFAMNLRDAIVNSRQEAPCFEIRTGINLGPVRIVRGVDGVKTTVGAGINCAARIMDFAGSNQILVSRSFYEVIGCLSEDYARLFTFAGTRADKHVQMFDVYEVSTPSEPGVCVEGKTQDLPQLSAPAKQVWPPDVLQSIETELADEIGPIAHVLVERMAHSAASIEDLLAMAAEKLHDRDAQEAFRNRLHHLAGNTAPLRNPAGNRDVDARAGVALLPETRAAASRLLAGFLGPIAPLLVDRAATRCRSREEFGKLLADELGEADERKAFLAALQALD